MVNAEQKLLNNGYEGVKFFTDYSYDTALIGVTTDNQAVYNFDLMVEWLVQNEKMTENEAIEWIEYNTIRALPYMGEGAPIIYFPLRGDDICN